LDLGWNQLSGIIPVELGDLTHLTGLFLDHNQLVGNIPPELGDLTNLKYLYLYDNQLRGTIPTTLGNLINLQALWLQNNHLSGDIPPTFINMVSLKDAGQFYGYDGLDLDYNYLNVPPDYPNPANPLHVFLSQKDPDWYLRQTILRLFYLPLLNR
jgi:hypothetical protein